MAVDIHSLEKQLRQRTEFLSNQRPPLWEHQLRAIEAAKDKDYYAFFFEVGCGKTRALIETLEYKYKKHKRTLRTIILCPLIVVENFRREIEKFGHIPRTVLTLTGHNRDRLNLFKKHMEDPNGVIFITNYEILYFNQILALFKKWEPEVLVADEIHKLKDPRAKRTNAATQIADKTLYRFGLSGTPVLNSQMDLFSQVRLLDRGETFGSNFYVFRAQYFFDANAGKPINFPNWIPKPGINEILRDKIKPFSMSIKKADCLDLPPLIVKELDIEMGKEQEKTYNDMKKDFIAYLNDKACVADLAIVKALRLQQIVSGFIKVEDQNGVETQVTFKDVPRIDALRNILEDITLTSKIIVWAVFKKNYEQIANVCDILKLQYCTLTGETLNRQAEVDKFQTDDKVRVMIANPGAGGIGINLTAASYMLYYSRNFSLEHEIQSEGRNYRGGSEIHEKITRIDFISRGTIDEIILKVLANKKSVGDNILSNAEILRTLKREL